jgi:AcrR family transcriptional regulator
VTSTPVAAQGGLGPGGVRPRNASASKDALLHAARMLFGQKGFEQTTIREIGQFAGVDAALIARYFGSKADLYVAAVLAESKDDSRPRNFESLDQIADALVTRTDKHGPGPVLQALIRSDTSDEIRAASRDHMVRRLIEPVVADMTDRGLQQPRLRSEVMVSALIGISLGRSLGWFEELRTVPKDVLVELLAELIDSEMNTAQETHGDDVS